MTEYKKQVKTFAGKVTIQDIQQEFDRLITGINNAVNTINSMNGIAELDFTKGSNRLSSKNYTLTLGSLKQVLNLYDGTVLGGTCVNINGACKVFPLLYVSRDKGIIHLKDQYLQANDKAIDLFFNPDTKDIGFPAGDWTEVTPTGGAGEVYQNLTSNNDWGSITANANSTEAYKATTSNGVQDQMYNIFPWTWTFPEQRTLIKFIASFLIVGQLQSNQWMKLRVETLDGRLVKDITLDANSGHQAVISNTICTEWNIDTGVINIPNTNGITIKRIGTDSNGGALKFLGMYLYDFGIQVEGASQAEIEGTPTQQGIDDLTGYKRIALLDWKRGFDILNTTEDNILCLPDNMPVLNITATQFTNTGKIPLNNSSKSCFFIPCCQFAGEGAVRTVELQGTTISRFGGDGHKSNSWIWAYNPIWIPSNLAITVTGNWNKMLNYKMVLQGEQT